LHPVSLPDLAPPSLPPVLPPRSIFLGIAMFFALGGAGAAWALHSQSEPAAQALSIGVSANSLRATTPSDTPSSPPVDPLAGSDSHDLQASPAPSPSPSSAPTPSPAAAAAGDAPAPTTEASAARPVHVIVYTTSWCPSCRAAKAWLNKNGIAYEERDIEASRTYAAQMRALNPRGSIPTFDVEGDVDVGFSSSWLVAMLRKHGSASSASTASN
jgi:glutaredoxin